ncbi:MAG TPA: TonB-dependent receptor [Candidatus Paceibacterota bacterium]|nr:TonB-dependent receptor [Candidatus Paceibacterota bacterium]
MATEVLSTNQKALRINLDAKRYGTFAEIGAGQEVARWFFRAGGASGTVAKTISAYDMAVSDAIYGHADRYVSRQRLRSMVDHEYGLMQERLKQTRGDKTAFFAFANTVATSSFSRREEGHGWMGIRFQTEPHSETSEILIHVRMLDRESSRQQEALGIVGVNLIHGTFYSHQNPEALIGSLLDNLTWERIEVDMIRFAGPAFAGVDNRLMALQLVKQGLTEAAMFTADGESVQWGEVLYKKPVLVQRGSFRPMTSPMLEMMERAEEQFRREESLQGEAPITILEMTLRQLQVGDAIDHKDFLERVDMLSALGKPVLISNFLRYHRVVTYLSRYTQKPIGLPLGLVRLRDILDEKFYTGLPGGLLESLGQLFRHGVKLYVYPSLDRNGKVTTAENMEVAPHLRHLYRHLVENRLVESIRDFHPEYLSIYPAEVLKRIQSGDVAWEQQVPKPLVNVIKAKRLFGWREK